MSEFRTHGADSAVDDEIMAHDVAGEISLAVTVVGSKFAAQSLAALAAALSSEGVADSLNRRFPDFAVFLDDGSNLVRCEAVGDPAGGAIKLERIKIEPGDRYVELVSAIAADWDQYVIRVAHGWPILSVVTPASVVVEVSGESINGGEWAA